MTKIKNLLILTLLSLFLISCHQEKSNSSLNFQLTKNDLLLASQSKEKSKSAISSLSWTTSPVWGQPDISDLTEISCYGVMVGGPEPDLKTNSCTLSDGNKIYFSPYTGMLPIDSPGNIKVFPGEGREIYLIGTSSTDSLCQSSLNSLTENSSNHSNPFVIGKAVAELIPGDNTVKVPLKNTFDSSHKILGCNFSDGTDSTSPTLPGVEDPAPGVEPEESSIAVSYFSSQRETWVDDNPMPRSVNIVKVGPATLECSKDAGSTYQPCSSPFIWEPSDYSIQHHIRLRDSNDTIVQEEVFQPSLRYPGISFVTCDRTLNSSSTFSHGDIDFVRQNANNVLCVGNNVQIDKGGGAPNYLNVSAANITIITRQGESSKIVGTMGFEPILVDNVADNFKLVGVELEAPTSYTTKLVNLSWGAQNVIFDGVHFEYPSGSSGLIRFGGNNSGIEIKNSNIIYHSTSETAMHVGENSASDSLTISNTTITTSRTALISTKASNVQIINSEIVVSGPTGKIAKVSAGSGAGQTASLSIENSKLFDGSGNGITLEAGFSSNIHAQLTLNGNTIIRLAFPETGNKAFVQAATGRSGDQMLNSTTSNYFCNETPATAQFSGMVSGVLGGSYTWDDANQSPLPANISTETCDPSIL